MGKVNTPTGVLRRFLGIIGQLPSVSKSNGLHRNSNSIQHWAIRLEFEYVGPTLFEDLLGVGRGLLLALRWVGSWFLCRVDIRFHIPAGHMFRSFVFSFFRRFLYNDR